MKQFCIRSRRAVLLILAFYGLFYDYIVALLAFWVLWMEWLKKNGE